MFVVGGGPGGLAAALALRRRGFEVTIADSCTPPIDKPCGEGLMPDGIDALAQLGISNCGIGSASFLWHSLREWRDFSGGGLPSRLRFGSAAHEPAPGDGGTS